MNPTNAPLGGLGRRAPSPHELMLWIAVAALLRVTLAAWVTEFVLVDDAYITLRYARNAAETGSLVYNAGESVFGVTSPLWGLVTSGLMMVFGRGGIEVAVFALGLAFWSAAAYVIASTLRAQESGYGAAFVRPFLSVFLFAPVFVDNQMLGMETPMFVCLAALAMCDAHRGDIRRSALWTGLLMVARPEGILFAPALLWLGHASSPRLLRDLAAPRCLALALGPGLLWIAFALSQYGTVLPQSMVAKSGWNSEHYGRLATLEAAWFGVARLTFLPFVDYLPVAMAHGLTALLIFGIAASAQACLTRGDAWSRAWMGTYFLFIAFYIAGKGATEASWYAVPPSVALLLGSSPWLMGLLDKRPALHPRHVAFAAAAILSVLSTAFVHRRAPLLHSYVDGYGACAASLADQNPGTNEAVLVGEIGVFGFKSDQPLIDVGALVSPEVLPLKNAGMSLVAIAQATGARWLVVSDIALERNFYPSVGKVWSGAEEIQWLAGAELVDRRRDKRLYRLRRSGSSAP